jgi:Cu(I)/Ag(I) efflux system membrane protein CusA/SilA
MIKNIINWSLSNRLLILILTVIISIWGIVAIKNTPLDAIPDLSDVQVIVKTSFPGQAPQVVEDQVTYPLTTAFLSVPKAVNVRGYSFFGDSYVYVIFEEGTDIYWARSRVLEYLSQVASRLPENAKAELGPDATGVGWVYEYALVDKSGQHDLSELRSLQDWFLKYELQTVAGVSEVATIGGMVKQYQIVLSPDKLREYNLLLSNVRTAITSNNQETGGSVIELAEAEYMIRASGYINEIKDIEDIVVNVIDDIPITIKDIAHIQIGPQMRRGVAELDGQGEVVGGVVIMRYGENALKTISAVKSKLEKLRSGLPKGVEIIETYDRSNLINKAVDNLNQKLLEEFLVVILVCALFLFHLRSSLVILISLSVGILVAFIVMQRLGINANIMSLGGIAIAIGAMVDAAIVMIENVHKRFEKNKQNKQNHWEIISESCVEVGPALFFSLLIITLSFLPIFALEAQEGKMFTPLAYTKTFAMAAAAALSVTLVPVLIGYFVRGKILPEYKNPINKALILFYRPILNFVLKFPKFIVLSALVVMFVSAIPYFKIGSEFMPDLDEGDLLYMPSTLPAISIGKAQEILQQTDKLIATVPEVKRVFGKVGRAETATDPAPLTMIETTVLLKDKSEWREGMTMAKLKEELNQLVKLPGITNAWVMPIKNRIDMLATGIKTPVGIKVAGPDLKVIEKIGKEIESIMANIPDTVSVYSERVVGGRYINVDINRNQAARYGLSIMQIQQYINTAIGGMNVTESVEGLERYPVNLRFPHDHRDSLDDLRNLSIITPTGAHINLSDVSKIYIEQGAGMIKTEDARLNGWIYVDIDTSDLGQYVINAQKIVSENIQLPTGYSIAWSGQFEYLLRAKEKMITVVPVTILIILLLLYFNFKNFTEVFIILGTLPLAFSGGVWLLYLLDYNMSVAVGVGFIALAGVSIELGVVMLLYLNQALNNLLVEDKITNVMIKQVVINGALMRIRPIVMTVATIIIGLFPIMLGSGTGSEIMQRIAAPMVGGMISAIVLNLLVLPAVYFLWKRPR